MKEDCIPTTNGRLTALDVMRGLTVMAMVIVNNGAGDESYEMLCHSAWNGLTPCDLVFPFFLFMVGVSISFSLGKHDIKTAPINHIISRSMKLFAIGVALHAFDMMTKCIWNPLPELRIWGVLQRIAICYLIVSMLVLCVKQRTMVIIASILLIVYGIIITTGNGYEVSSSNIIARIDNYIVGADHLYKKSPIDPEGLLSTLPSIAHTILGVICGNIIRQKNELNTKLINLFAFGTILMLIGWLLQFGLPLNKRIWSPSYAILTSGIASTLLGLLIYIIDVKKHSKWCKTAKAFGMNAFCLYTLSEVLSPLIRHTGAGKLVYDAIYTIIPHAKTASMAYAISFCIVVGIPGWILWKKQKFIKI